MVVGHALAVVGVVGVVAAGRPLLAVLVGVRGQPGGGQQQPAVLRRHVVVVVVVVHRPATANVSRQRGRIGGGAPVLPTLAEKKEENSVPEVVLPTNYRTIRI